MILKKKKIIISLLSSITLVPNYPYPTLLSEVSKVDGRGFKKMC